jgi:NitT/TauT family transport system permease protein
MSADDAPVTSRVPGLGARLLAILWGSMPALVFVALIAIWWAAVDIFNVASYLLPPPQDVLPRIFSSRQSLWNHSLVTMQEIIMGFGLSVVTAIPMGLLIALSPVAKRMLYPFLMFIQLVPKIAIAPLFVVWFGFGIIPKVISAFLLGFFPVVVSAVQGFKSVDPDMVDLARAMQGSRFNVFCAVNLPHAMPAIFSGLKVSLTLAVVGAVVGEFVGSNSGIGYVLQRSIGTFDLPTMFAALVILALLGVVLFWIVDRIERLIIPWHVSQREDIIFAA